MSIATDVREGIDLNALEQALKEYPVKACWIMTNSQNPLGFTLSAEKKAQLVALLTQHNVPLIEDDVYSELYFGREKPLPAKAWDRQLDAGLLSEKALTHHISIAPGKMFSTSDAWTPFFRFNTSWAWGEREEQAVIQLGKLISTMLE